MSFGGSGSMPYASSPADPAERRTLSVAAVGAAEARRNRFSAMQKRSLGPFTVTAFGLGAMPMSWNRDNEIPEESQSIKTIHAAHGPDHHFKTLQDEGKIKAIGISNANVDEIEVAIQVLGEGGLTSVQNEFSPRFRNSQKELEFCGERGIAFLPWSPLGGTGGAGRKVGERFAVFSEIARGHGVSPQQVVLAWELSLGSHVIPIPGARRPESIMDSAKATGLVLSDAELARCSASGRTG
jgi:aryl-alcohol dehydrogenase-like predicted oxidoreductase